jgi:hypothetical protein
MLKKKEIVIVIDFLEELIILTGKIPMTMMKEQQK